MVTTDVESARVLHRGHARFWLERTSSDATRTLICRQALLRNACVPGHAACLDRFTRAMAAMGMINRPRIPPTRVSVA